MGHLVKKIDASFGRLRERRRLVGSLADNTDQSDEAVKQQLIDLARTKDIGAILKTLTRAMKTTPTDYIQKTVGSMMYLYYSFVDNLHSRPRDFDDFIDGLLYLEAKAYSHKYDMENR
jgi:hypothetical protein